MLHVGDIWHDHRFESMPDCWIEQCDSLEVSTAASALIKPGLNLEDSQGSQRLA
ncbi:MAG TPA: hypothetical protein VF798_14405 [Burkholderiaceae bacterium]